MREKGRLFSTVISIISLVLLGYVLFISIYDQMISQNEGFFYVLVFGGILVLAFILLSLMTKLMAYSNDLNGRTIWIVVEIIVFIGLVAVFFLTRMSYTSTLPPTESLYYRAAEVMYDGSLSINGMDLISQLINKPAQLVLAVFVSLLFDFTGVNPDAIVYVNVAFFMLTLLCVYFSARLIGGKSSGLVAAAFAILMPCQAFAVYSYDAQLCFAFFAFAALLMYLLYALSDYYSVVKLILFNILYGVFSGVCIVMEPAAIIVFVFLFIFSCVKVIKGWLSALISLVAMLAVFFSCFFVNANLLDASAIDMFEAYGRRFDITMDADTGVDYGFQEAMENFHSKINSQDKAITDNYYFLSNNKTGQSYSSMQAAWFQLGNQLLYLFLIVLSIACVFYLMRLKSEGVVPLLFTYSGAFLVLLFETGKERNTFFFVELLIAIGAVSLNYMYRNHHPELISSTVVDLEEIANVKKDEEPSMEESIKELSEEEQAELQRQFMQRAYALIFIGMNEGLYNKIREEEKSTMRSPRERLPLPDISYESEVTSTEASNKEFSLSASFGQSIHEPVNKPEIKPEIKPVNKPNNIPNNIPVTLPSLKELTAATPIKGQDPNPTKDMDNYYFDEESVQEEVKKKPVKLLDNPLPGPKEHVPRVLDYSHDNGASDGFDFDFDVPFSDDFDV